MFGFLAQAPCNWCGIHCERRRAEVAARRRRSLLHKRKIYIRGASVPDPGSQSFGVTDGGTVELLAGRRRRRRRREAHGWRGGAADLSSATLDSRGRQQLHRSWARVAPVVRGPTCRAPMVATRVRRTRPMRVVRRSWNKEWPGPPAPRAAAPRATAMCGRSPAEAQGHDGGVGGNYGAARRRRRKRPAATGRRESGAGGAGLLYGPPVA